MKSRANSCSKLFCTFAAPPLDRHESDEDRQANIREAERILALYYHEGYYNPGGYEPRDEDEARGTVAVADMVIRHPLWNREVATIARGPQYLHHDFNPYLPTRNIIFEQGLIYREGPPHSYFQPQDLQALCGICALNINNGEPVLILYPCAHRGNYACICYFNNCEISNEKVLVNSEISFSRFLDWYYSVSVHRNCQRIYKLANRDKVFFRCQFGYCSVLSVDDADHEFNYAMLLMQELAGWRYACQWRMANGFNEDYEMMITRCIKNLMAHFRWKYNPNYPDGNGGACHWRPMLVDEEVDILDPERWNEEFPVSLEEVMRRLAQLKFVNGSERPFDIEDRSRRLATNQKEIDFAQLWEDHVLEADEQFVAGRIAEAMKYRTNVDLISLYGIYLEFTNTRFIVSKVRIDPNSSFEAIPEDFSDADPNEWNAGQSGENEPPQNGYARRAAPEDDPPEEYEDRGSSSAGDRNVEHVEHVEEFKSYEPKVDDLDWVKSLVKEDKDVFEIGYFVVQEMLNDLSNPDLERALVAKYQKWLSNYDFFRRQVLDKSDGTISDITILGVSDMATANTVSQQEIVSVDDSCSQSTTNSNAGMGISSILSMHQDNVDSGTVDYSFGEIYDFENKTEWSRNVTSNYSLIRKYEQSGWFTLVALDPHSPPCIALEDRPAPAPTVWMVSVYIITAADTAQDSVLLTLLDMYVRLCVCFFRNQSLRFTKMTTVTRLSKRTIRCMVLGPHVRHRPQSGSMMSPPSSLPRLRTTIKEEAKPTSISLFPKIWFDRYPHFCDLKVCIKIIPSIYAHCCSGARPANFMCHQKKLSPESPTFDTLVELHQRSFHFCACLYGIRHVYYLRGYQLFFVKLLSETGIRIPVFFTLPMYVYTFITKGYKIYPHHLYSGFQNKRTTVYVSFSKYCYYSNGCSRKREGESSNIATLPSTRLNCDFYHVCCSVIFITITVLPTMALSKPNQRDLSVHFATGFFEAESREVISRKDLYGDSVTWDIERLMFNKLVGLLKQALTYLKRHRKGNPPKIIAWVLLNYAIANLMLYKNILAPNFHVKAAEMLRSIDAQIEVVCGVLTSLEADKSRVITLLTYLWPDYVWTYIVTKLMSQVELDTIKIRGLKFGYVAKQSIMKLRNAITFVFSYGYLPLHYHKLFMHEENYKLWRQYAETMFPIVDMLKRPHFIVLREQLQVYNLAVEDLDTLSNDDHAVEATNLL